LLRMVHLSSVLPIEAQGHLGSLVEQYVQPILLEGRVPLARSLPLELSCDEEQLFTAAGCKNGGRVLAITDSCSAQPAQELSEGQKDTLKQLTATRRDCSRVMARLPPQALVGPGQRSGKHVDLQDAQDLLHDLFASVLVMVPSGATGGASGSGSSWAFGGSRRPTRPTTSGSCAPRAAAALGYRYGEQVYGMEAGIRSSILLRAATLQGHDSEDAPRRTGRISDLRRTDRQTSNAERGAEELEIPLAALLDEAPSAEDVATLWAALGTACPGWYGENALQERRSALQRITSVARQLRRNSEV